MSTRHAGKPVHLHHRVLETNSLYTPLNNGETFTGEWEEVLQYPTTMVALTADQNCTYKIQYSPDAVNIDSTLSFTFRVGDIEPPKRITNTRRYARIVVENDSGSNMTELRLQTIVGHHGLPNSPLNGTITPDSDAVLVRSVPMADELPLGNYQGIQVADKFGRNADIDTATVPETIWNGGGVYTGFPTGAAEQFQILCDAGDVGGEVTFNYLADFTSEDYQTATVTLTGTTTNTGITGVRSNRAIFNNSGPANVGDITIRHATTTANVFAVIPAGYSQTQILAYTIPANNNGIIKRIKVDVSKANTAVVDGALAVRPLGKSTRLTRSFSASNSNEHIDELYSGLVIAGFADIDVRITSSSANNVAVTGQFEVLVYNGA